MNDGRYSLIYPTGDYRTVEVKTLKKGNLANRTILKIKEGRGFTGVGFLRSDGKVNFWSRFKAQNQLDRLQRIQKAVDRIVADPEAAGLAYAMKENRCYRCGRELTVPASIHRGMGPECANKNWTKRDQQEAYRWREDQAKERKAAGSSLNQAEESVASGRDMETQQKNLFAEEERKQEEKAFMSDPNLFPENWTTRPVVMERLDLSVFQNQRCGICGVPRYRCSC